MLQARVIPCLQLIGESLVKTVRFGSYSYIGDPVNTVRIFNELEVDELCFLDIRASLENRNPNLEILSQIADECFMPLSYGGGIRDFETAQKILSIGFEKVVLNTAAAKNPMLINKIAEHFGSQAVIGSLDVKKNLFGKYQVHIKDGTEKLDKSPVEWSRELQNAGAGEILLTSMDRDGTWSGYDTELIKSITQNVNVPVIASGGAGSIDDIISAVQDGGASAAALGSMVVYQAKGMGVLVNFPDKEKLELLLSNLRN